MLASAQARQPFDLSRGPLLRVNLIKLAPQQFVVVLVMHHIISDGWSMNILVNEITTLYEAFSADRPSPLEELTIQYADYAVWQREWLKGEVLDEQMQYWREQLSGSEFVLQMPTDKPRPAVQSFRGAMIRFEVGREITEELKADKQEGISDAVYDIDGGVQDIAEPLQQSRGGDSRDADSRPQMEGGGGADRVLRKHASDEERGEGRRELHRVVEESEGERDRSIRASGCAVREAGRGVAAREGFEPDADLPGDVTCSPECGWCGSRSAGRRYGVTGSQNRYS